MFENKENTFSSPNTIADKRVESLKPQARGGAFGKLLGAATNEVRSEHDSKVAMQSQVDEAVEIVGEWIREENDSDLARKLAATWDDEAKTRKALEIAMGESEALRVAVQERRRMKDDAEQKKTVAQRDEQFALKMAADDEEERETHRRRCLEEDERFARDVDEKATPKKQPQEREENDRAESKAEEKFSYDDKQYSLREEKENKDTSESPAEMQARQQQIQRDFDVARVKQQEADTAHKTSRFNQERSDYMLSRKLAVKTERAEHRRLKRLEVLAAITSFPTEALIAEQWEQAAAQVEDVCDGICITLLLPNIIKVKVSVTGNSGRKVLIDAARMTTDSAIDSPDNSQYLAEFKIDGSNVKLTDDDVSFDYSSETGLLHIYVESVSLDGDDEDSAASEEKSSGNGKQGGKSRFDVGSNVSAKVVDAMRSGFSRVFGSVGSSKNSRK